MEYNKIFNEDCLETMKRFDDRSIDIILTSPPYNNSRKNGNTEYGLKKHQIRYIDFDDRKDNDEYISWTLERFSKFNDVLKDSGVVLYNMSYNTELVRQSELVWLVVSEIIKQGYFTIGDCIVWKKKNAMPNNTSNVHLTRICEYVFVFCKRDSFSNYHRNHKIVSTAKSGQNFYDTYNNFVEAKNNDGLCETHKATYSTELCNKLLNIYGEEGMVVYDPFIGTGTTAISAIRSGLNYLGSEICKEYYELADERIKNEKMQLSLF